MRERSALRRRASPVLAWLVRASTRRPRAVIGAWLAARARSRALGSRGSSSIPTTESILAQEGDAWRFYRESLAAYGGDEILVVALESERPFDPRAARARRRALGAARAACAACGASTASPPCP